MSNLNLKSVTSISKSGHVLDILNARRVSAELQLESQPEPTRMGSSGI